MRVATQGRRRDTETKCLTDPVLGKEVSKRGSRTTVSVFVLFTRPLPSMRRRAQCGERSRGGVVATLQLFPLFLRGSPSLFKRRGRR